MSISSFPSLIQSKKEDSAAACLKIVAKYFNKYYSLEFFQIELGINSENISLLDLSYTAENIGLRTVAITCNLQRLALISLPCIVHWQQSHYIIIYRVNKHKIYVSDPTKGLIEYTLTDFEKGWIKNNEGKAALLTLQPRFDFNQAGNEKDLMHRNIFSKFSTYFIPYRSSVVNLILVMLIVTILEALLPFISKAVIDIGLQTQNIRFINLILIANILIIISSSLSEVVRNWIMLHTASRINIELIADYLIKLMKLPISFFENTMAGDILQRAQDHERIRSFIMNHLLNIFFSILTFSVFGIILLCYSKLIFLVFILGSILYLIWLVIFLRLRKQVDLLPFH